MAIPAFNGRVAPVFDWAGTLIVIDFDRLRERQRSTMTITDIRPYARPQHLRQLQVDVLVCGAISKQLLLLVEHECISVLPWLTGEIDAVVDTVTNGNPTASERHQPVASNAADGSTTTAKLGSSKCQTRK